MTGLPKSFQLELALSASDPTEQPKVGCDTILYEHVNRADSEYLTRYLAEEFSLLINIAY